MDLLVKCSTDDLWKILHTRHKTNTNKLNQFRIMDYQQDIRNSRFSSTNNYHDNNQFNYNSTHQEPPPPLPSNSHRSTRGATSFQTVSNMVMTKQVESKLKRSNFYSKISPITNRHHRSSRRKSTTTTFHIKLFNSWLSFFDTKQRTLLFFP